MFTTFLISSGIIGSLLLPLHTQTAASLMVGSIQFPASVTVPPMRVYSCGTIIPSQLCEIDQAAKQFMYRIPQVIKNNQFHLLVTKKIHPKTRANDGYLKSNTVNYLKVPFNQPYAFYHLALLEKNEDNKVTLTWEITKKTLDPETQRIPDETIIICYDSHYVESLTGEGTFTLLSGSSSFTLPTIHAKANILDMVGSENNLQELSAKILLGTLDTDTFHASIDPVCQHIVNDRHTPVTLVAPITS